MTTIALFEAKNRLSELIDRVQAGEHFEITRRGKVVASLTTAQESSSRAMEAVEGLRATRKGVSLGRLKSRDLMTEGRR